ncbi:MAG: caspase family protein [Spirochaetales bacterium]
MKRLVLLTLAVGLMTTLTAADLRRFALFVGADNGGSGRVALRYAVSDAKALQGVLTELGGLASSDSSVLGNPDRNAVLKSLASFGPRVAQGKLAGSRAEFLFYYSGHSDENGLLLGNTRIGYGELRDALAGVGADVRLAVLDSCASGAFTRLKGGTKTAPFLQDESSVLEGHAYLTSSSEDEASQESDKIGGSFFTHYLISGLRGAADTTGDGRVSLNEAYRHAFDETLARTEDTQAGPQHPSYDIQLSGTGDLVLTDLTQKTSRLVLGPDVAGQVFVRTQSGSLVVEVRKSAGEALSLAVPAGVYEVALQAPEGFSQTRRGVVAGEAANVSAADFTLGTKQATRVRGSASGGAAPTVVGQDYLRLNFGLTPGLELFDASDKTTALSLHGILSVTGYSRVLQLAGVGNLSQGNEGLQGAGVFNIVSGEVLGAQSAGVFNLSGPLRGAQLGGVFNQAESVWGLQAAGVLNIAGDVSGLQTAGVVNIARNVKGFQLGLVNIANHVDGMALGLVNIADNSYGSLGFDYDVRGQQWTTLEWGAGTLHNILIAAPGTQLALDGLKGIGLGLGWGKEVRLETQAVAFYTSSGWNFESTAGAPVAVTPAFRAVLNAKLGFLGVHVGWLGTAGFPGYTADTTLVGGPDTLETQAFTPGYTWLITGRPFLGASIGF